MTRRKRQRSNKRKTVVGREADVMEMFGLEAVIRPLDKPEQLVRALLRKKIARKPGVVVGDRVRFADVEEDVVDQDRPGAVIVAVEPRKNALMRAGWRGHAQVIASNLDYAVIVVTPSMPPLRPGLIDRYLAACFQGGVSPIICLNKVDLDPDGTIQRELSCYEGLGVPIIRTQAGTSAPADVSELSALIGKSRSVFVGHSGVGKSSLAKALIPGLNRLIGGLNEVIGRGRHTTTRSSLLMLPDGGELVDTPGIRSFGLFGIKPKALSTLYPEFQGLSDGCRFRGCTHLHEPSCAVKQAVEEGELNHGRYERYCQLYSSLEEELLANGSFA